MQTPQHDASGWPRPARVVHPMLVWAPHPHGHHQNPHSQIQPSMRSLNEMGWANTLRVHQPVVKGSRGGTPQRIEYKKKKKKKRKRTHYVVKSHRAS
jgi:hypothetical protein